MNIIIDRTADLAYIRQTMDALEDGKLDRAATLAAMGLMYYHLDRCVQEQERMFQLRHAAAAIAVPPVRRGNIIPFPGACGRQPMAMQARK